MENETGPSKHELLSMIWKHKLEMIDLTQSLQKEAAACGNTERELKKLKGDDRICMQRHRLEMIGFCVQGYASRLFMKALGTKEMPKREETADAYTYTFPNGMSFSEKKNRETTKFIDDDLTGGIKY